MIRLYPRRSTRRRHEDLVQEGRGSAGGRRLHEPCPRRRSSRRERRREQPRSVGMSPSPGVNPDAKLIGLGRSSPAAHLVPLRRGRAAASTMIVVGGILLDPVVTVCVALTVALALDLAISLFYAGLAIVGLRWPTWTGRPPALREEELPAYTVL